MTFSRFWSPRVRRHFIAWALIISLFEYLDRIVLPGKLRVFGLPYSLPVLLGPALAVYAHFWLLTHELERRRYGRYLAGTLATLVLGSLVLAAVGHAAPAMQAVRGDAGVTVATSAAATAATWPMALAQAAANVLVTLVMATGVRYVRRGIASHFQLQQLRAQQLETELSLLKAQVNQHFLFNTLNNLYGLSLAAPDQIPEALLQLAGLMRYQLDSSRQTTVTVGTEAEYLANYIGLEKLRLRDASMVEFVSDLPHPNRPLAPLLLLPLVENCFKHAIDPSGTTFIRISLHQTDTSLTLRTHNSIPPRFRPVPSGLGLPNLRTRLAQFYPDGRHRLSVEATATEYTATLQLVQ